MSAQAKTAPTASFSALERADWKGVMQIQPNRGERMTIAEVKQFGAVFNSARESAKAEILLEIDKQLAVLADIGFHYEVVEGTATRQLRQMRSAFKRKPGHCSICQEAWHNKATCPKKAETHKAEAA